MNKKISQILTERFGHDNVIALATLSENKRLPRVRMVDGYYEDGCFYIITYALSDKMKQIGIDPHVSVAGEWFTSYGEGENIGWFCSEENRSLAEKLRQAFASWIDNGHNNFEDKNTVILKIKLTEGILLSNGERYEVKFPL